jgi:hypothetical protein
MKRALRVAVLRLPYLDRRARVARVRAAREWGRPEGLRYKNGAGLKACAARMGPNACATQEMGQA